MWFQVLLGIISRKKTFDGMTTSVCLTKTEK